MLRLWNTLHRALEPFSSIQEGKVGLYSCGPTVYSSPQLGNWRKYVCDDALRRAFELFGYDVRHVLNITDVGHLVADQDEGEDKVEREARRRGVNAWEIAKMYEKEFVSGMKDLHILPPTIICRATDHIQEQIDLIATLEQKGFTYRIQDGMYFDTSRDPEYGRLSGQKLEEKEAGARVEVNPEKRHPADFALWKFSPVDQQRDMEWESPWGKGFPGWHIECSAMSTKYLGQPFDVHTGGVDHIPVHHENEMAQSECALGKPLANYWLHTEFLSVDGRRMGKSEGNAYTLVDLVEKGFDPIAFRYFCFGAHYRSKLNFTWEALEGAENALKRLIAIARSLPAPSPSTIELDPGFIRALEDDVNMPQVLAAMWDLLKSDRPDQEKSAQLSRMDNVLGFGLDAVLGVSEQVPPEIVALAEERRAARSEKNWSQSDALRLEIERHGWKIEDAEDGSYILVIY